MFLSLDDEDVGKDVEGEDNEDKAEQSEDKEDESKGAELEEEEGGVEEEGEKVNSLFYIHKAFKVLQSDLIFLYSIFNLVSIN